MSRPLHDHDNHESFEIPHAAEAQKKLVVEVHCFPENLKSYVIFFCGLPAQALCFMRILFFHVCFFLEG